jgi:hypothetical protein
MADDYDDHQELDDQIDQEEAHFYFTINEFQDCIDKYGCAFVLSKMNKNIKQLMKEKLDV